MKWLVEADIGGEETTLEVLHMYDLRGNDTFDRLACASAVILNPLGVPCAIDIPSPNAIHTIQ